MLVMFLIGLGVGFLLRAWVTHVGYKGAMQEADTAVKDVAKKL